MLQDDAGKATVSGTNNGDGTADLVVTRTGTFPGSVRVIVGVRSASSNFDTQVFTVAFGDQLISLSAAGPVNATEGAGATLTLATLTDADAAAVPTDYQVSINWGDGSPLDTTTGRVVLDNGQFKVTGQHTYREAGTYPVRVVVTGVPPAGAGGATSNRTLTATVADAARTSQGVAVSGTTAGSTGPVTVATFTAANSFAEARDFTAQITWGDGASSAGTVVAAPGGGFRVLGSHAYAAVGQYPVSVTVTQILTAGTVPPATTTATTTASIAAAPIPPAPAPAPAPAAPPLPVVASLVTLRKGGRVMLTVRVTGRAVMQFLSPFQKSAGYQQIAAVAIDTDGDGVTDSVEVRARRGKRLLKRLLGV